jgi:hypothetical protein
MTRPSCIVFLIMALACGELDPEVAPPLASAEDGNPDLMPTCTVERVITWLDGPPDSVTVSYVVSQPADIVPECGFIDDAPSCWFVCGPSYARGLSVDWTCGTGDVMHVLVEKPIPDAIELDGCQPADGTESGSGTGETSGSESGSESGAGETSGSEGTTEAHTSETTAGSTTDSSTT